MVNATAGVTRVWIAQCLCQDRHTIIAVAGLAHDVEEAQTSLGQLRTGINDALKKHLISPWCGLCHAPAADWKYEVRPSRFVILAEAEPTLRDLEMKNIVTNALWGDIPRNWL